MSPAPLTTLERDYLAAAERGDHTEAARLEALVDAAHEAKQGQLAQPGALLAAALWYADTLGLPVFPCLPGGKRPLTAHGYKDATTDLDRIRAWWKASPEANIGIPTGGRFEVFDVDGPEGLIALGDYMDQGAFPIPLGIVLTPRGRHIYVPPTGAGNTTGLLPKVDVRGVGGYVVAPPSRTPEGTYFWDTPLTPETLEQRSAA